MELYLHSLMCFNGVRRNMFTFHASIFAQLIPLNFGLHSHEILHRIHKFSQYIYESYTSCWYFLIPFEYFCSGLDVIMAADFQIHFGNVRLGVLTTVNIKMSISVVREFDMVSLKGNSVSKASSTSIIRTES